MPRNRPYSQALAVIFILLTTQAQAERIDVGRFSAGELDDWQEKSFEGNSQYRLVKDGESTVLKTHTSATASGLFREIEIDLNKTPYLNWSWRVDNIYLDNNERDKAGDDYPARVYVVVSGGLLFWRTRAINYVWSRNQAVGSGWDNAYTDKAKMVAVRSGHRETGRWLSEKRNIRQDLQRLFGEEIEIIHAVAIMSDSDNTGQAATAFYGDIYFSSD
jgi:hypothetical protein